MTLQIDADGRLRHLLTLEGLPRAVLERLLDRAEALHPHAHGGTGVRVDGSKNRVQTALPASVRRRPAASGPGAASACARSSTRSSTTRGRPSRESR